MVYHGTRTMVLVPQLYHVVSYYQFSEFGEQHGIREEGRELTGGPKSPADVRTEVCG